MQRGFSGVLLIFVVLLLAGGSYGGYYFLNQKKINSINSFEECAKYFPVMESFPEQCNTPDGKHFVQQLSEEEKKKITSTQVDGTENWHVYKNSKYGFEIKYPEELSQYTNLSTDDFFVITYPGPSDVNLFNIRVFKTNLADREADWWRQVGKTYYPQMLDPKLSYASFVIEDEKNIQGMGVYGNRKSPGGVVIPYSLLVFRHNDYLMVIDNHTEEYENGKYAKIQTTLKFL